MQIGVETSRAVENHRVFVVHDDEIVRAALQFMLHDEHEAHELASVEQAYAKADDTGPPDVVLLAVEIARIGGAELLEQLATRYPAAKVLLVTDGAYDEFAQSCLGSQAHGLVPKPFTVESVRRKVDLALGKAAPISIPVQLA
jgi:DNA-binding NtrC family response regulator